LQIRTVGTSGTMVGVGIYKKVPAAEATYSAVDDILASTTIDTTIDQIVCVGLVYSAPRRPRTPAARLLPGHRPLGDMALLLEELTRQARGLYRLTDKKAV
jgi:hypothetical protein